MVAVFVVVYCFRGREVYPQFYLIWTEDGTLVLIVKINVPEVH